MNNLVDIDLKNIWHPFTQAKLADHPILITRAKGTRLYTQSGDEIIDYISSWWVNTLGHCNDEIVELICEEVKSLDQIIFAGFTHKNAIKLSESLLKELSHLSRIFFSDNGSTSVEVALKMAYQYNKNLSYEKNKFLAFDGSYHGDTIGAMSLGKGSKFFNLYEDLLFEVDFIPYPFTYEGDDDIELKEERALAHLNKLLDSNKICAFILEPLIQGAGGMRVLRVSFLNKLLHILKQKDILIIFDEVMTGFYRTGSLFAYNKLDIEPDIICLSKGLTAGFLPLSLTVCKEYIYEAFLGDNFSKALVHGHSFTANPISCAIASKSLEILKRENTKENIDRIIFTHKQGMQILKKSKYLNNFRQMGTILAFDLKVEDSGYNAKISTELKRKFLEKKALIRPLGNVIYIMPPYCMSDEELYKGYEIIDEVINSLKG